MRRGEGRRYVKLFSGLVVFRKPGLPFAPPHPEEGGGTPISHCRVRIRYARRQPPPHIPGRGRSSIGEGASLWSWDVEVCGHLWTCRGSLANLVAWGKRPTAEATVPTTKRPTAHCGGGIRGGTPRLGVTVRQPLGHRLLFHNPRGGTPKIGIKKEKVRYFQKFAWSVVKVRKMSWCTAVPGGNSMDTMSGIPCGNSQWMDRRMEHRITELEMFS